MPFGFCFVPARSNIANIVVDTKEKRSFFLSFEQITFIFAPTPASGQVKVLQQLIDPNGRCAPKRQKAPVVAPFGSNSCDWKLCEIYSSALNSAGQSTFWYALPLSLKRCAAPAGADAVTVSPILTRLCPGARTVTRSPLASFKYK